MIKNKAGYYTTKEAAGILGFTQDHVRRMILQGKIKAEKLAHNWLIRNQDLSRIKRKRFPRQKDDDSGSIRSSE